MKPENPKIKLVDGAKVRNRHIDFALGGHHWRYPWIPASEVWVERILRGCDRAATVVHELAEVKAMRRGLGYDEAHKLANGVERRYRRRVCSRGTKNNLTP